ncbi:MAG TPA: NIPSNAP family protein [Burkholderiales bacterium]|jgi:hypothetical protein
MTKRLIEVRSYKLKPGAAAAFHAAAVSAAVPLLHEWGMDVVAFGPSPHEPDTYFLIRAYADLADRNAQQEAFYGSDAWKNGPRESIVPLVVSYLNTVLWMSQEAIDDLRRCNSGPGS